MYMCTYIYIFAWNDPTCSQYEVQVMNPEPYAPSS